MPLYKGSTQIPGGRLYKSTTNISYGYKGTDPFFVNNATVDFLVIAGGGGGGSSNATGYIFSGGGGAGGYRSSWNNEPSGGNSASENSLIITPSTNLTVTVGEGGVNGADVFKGANGQDSVFHTITSIGGGGGGSSSAYLSTSSNLLKLNGLSLIHI